MCTKRIDINAVHEGERLRQFFLRLSDEQLHYIVCDHWLRWLVDPVDNVWQYYSRNKKMMDKSCSHGRLLTLDALLEFALERSLPTINCIFESERTQWKYRSLQEMESREDSGDDLDYTLYFPSIDVLRQRIADMDILEFIFSIAHIAYVYFVSYAETSYFETWQPSYPVPPSGLPFAAYAMKQIRIMLANYRDDDHHHHTVQRVSS